MFRCTNSFPFPFRRLMYDDFLASKSVHGPVKSGFLFLINLAWESRFRLPIVVFFAYMFFDIRVQFEMNIHRPRRELNEALARMERIEALIEEISDDESTSDEYSIASEEAMD